MSAPLTLGVALVLFSCLVGCRTPEDAAGRPAASELASAKSKFQDTSSKQLRALIRQCAADDHNMDLRYASVADVSITKFLGRQFWRDRYPVHYAKAKLLTKGRAAVLDLLRIVTDPGMRKEDRAAAWMLIGDMNGLDEPGALALLLEQYQRGQLDPNGIYWPIYRNLMIDHWLDFEPMVLQDGIGAWLAEQLRTKDYAQIAMDQLDERMKPNRFRMSPRTFMFRRLLNRINDHDLDEWLAQNHPAAYAFRQKELARGGYDPADRLSEYLSLLEVWNELDTAIATIFADKADQRGCRELVEAMEGEGTQTLANEVGWEDRLRAWYSKNHNSFKYSFDKHRFVLQQGAER